MLGIQIAPPGSGRTHPTVPINNVGNDAFQYLRKKASLLQEVLLLALLTVLYARILVSLVSQWINDPNYSYAFFIPPFSAWIIWREKERLGRVRVRPNNTGLLLVVGALGLLVLGVVGAENFLSRSSLLFLIAGLTIYFAGWGIFRAALFPWTVLFLMIPVPAIILNQITFPLQFGASKLAENLLSVFGVPVLREGNIIHLPSIDLDVVEACSGIRSLASLLTLSVGYGYLLERRTSVRILLIFSSIPIAVAANGFRIMGSGLLGEYWSHDMAEGFFHVFSGILIFTVALALLIAADMAFSWLAQHRLRQM
jgi:exosortase